MCLHDTNISEEMLSWEQIFLVYVLLFNSSLAFMTPATSSAARHFKERVLISTLGCWKRKRRKHEDLFGIE